MKIERIVEKLDQIHEVMNEALFEVSDEDAKTEAIRFLSDAVAHLLLYIRDDFDSVHRINAEVALEGARDCALYLAGERKTYTITGGHGKPRGK